MKNKKPKKMSGEMIALIIFLAIVVICILPFVFLFLLKFILMSFTPPHPTEVLPSIENATMYGGAEVYPVGISRADSVWILKSYYLTSRYGWPLGLSIFDGKKLTSCWNVTNPKWSEICQKYENATKKDFEYYCLNSLDCTQTTEKRMFLMQYVADSFLKKILKERYLNESIEVNINPIDNVYTWSVDNINFTYTPLWDIPGRNEQFELTLEISPPSNEVLNTQNYPVLKCTNFTRVCQGGSRVADIEACNFDTDCGYGTLYFNVLEDKNSKIIHLTSETAGVMVGCTISYPYAIKILENSSC